MAKKIFRKDLMNKSDYSKAFNVSRPTIDKMINNGELSVEVISNTEYVKLK